MKLNEDGGIFEGQWKNGNPYDIQKYFSYDGKYYAFIPYNEDGKENGWKIKVYPNFDNSIQSVTIQFYENGAYRAKKMKADLSQ